MAPWNLRIRCVEVLQNLRSSSRSGQRAEYKHHFLIVGGVGLTLAVTRALEMWGSLTAGDVWLRLSSWNWCGRKFSWRFKVLNIIDPLKIDKRNEKLLFKQWKPFQDHFGKRDATSIKCQMLIGFYRDSTSFRGTFFLLHFLQFGNLSVRPIWRPCVLEVLLCCMGCLLMRTKGWGPPTMSVDANWKLK